VSVARSRLIPALAALVLWAGAALGDAAPQRVVSINLCTDQLALALAAPGQLVSVSRLSHDPSSSALWEEARALPANGSSAEEVYLLDPDLVLAGSFTAPATLAMLRDLGIRVEVFSPARSLDDIAANMARMGAALGREEAARAALAAFTARRAALEDAPARRPRAALYYVNSYTAGDATLAGAILRAAGFANIAGEAGLDHGGTLALERLVMMQPEAVVIGRDYPGHARAEDNLRHPALAALRDTVTAGTLTDRDWICGTPRVLDAVEAMRDLRLSLEAEG